jgi:hypothetical protein
VKKILFIFVFKSQKNYLDMNLHRRETRFLIRFLMVVYIPFYALTYIAQSISPESFLSVESGEFYANLRSSGVGCRNLPWKNSEVLIIGDSHTYSGLNFNLISKSWNNHDLSVCTIGGLNMKAIPLILKKIRKKKFIPKVVIYGASIFQFADRNNSHRALLKQKNVINQKGNIKLLLKSGIKKIMGLPIGVYSESMEIDRLKKNKKFVQGSLPQLKFFDPNSNIANGSVFEGQAKGLSSEQVARYMNKFPNSSMKEWKSGMSELKIFSPDLISRQVNKICSLIKYKDAKFYVVDIPVSPLARSMISPELLKTYIERIKIFESCADKILFPDTRSLGLGNQHFINRYMDGNFPYHNINEEKLIPHPFNDYDLDHMNLVGAELFSKFIVRSLRPTFVNN